MKMIIIIRMGITIKMVLISKKNNSKSPINKLGIKIKDNGATMMKKIITQTKK